MEKQGNKNRQENNKETTTVQTTKEAKEGRMRKMRFA
jgi:hypothetical protein